MSAEAFIRFRAHLRRHPRGFYWENWKQAQLCREINKMVPRLPGDKLKPINHWLWKPPELLYAQRMKREAKEAQAKEAKRDG